MKKILILIFSLFIIVFGYAQTQIDPLLTPTAARANAAIKGSITASGTNTYTATVANFTLVSGEAMDITFTNGNTGASTFNLNGVGALTIKKFSSGSLVDLVSGDISNLERKRLYHNGTFLVIEGGTGSGGGSGTVTSASVVTANGVSATVANATTTPAFTFTLGAINPTTVNTITFSGSSTPTLAVTGTTTISGTHSGTSSGANTGDQDLSGLAVKANNLSDLTNAGTARTNLGLGTLSTQSITFGTGVATALAVNIGSAGAPVLFNGAGGTPSSLVGTNITGTAAGLTAGNVTTNANLTGHVTSTGNAAVLGSFSSSNLSTALTDETGTGVAVFGTTPTIATPSITTGFTIGGAATSRKMIVGNGTNFVPSTETWAVPGTTGNILTSNGTNWISTTPASGVFTTPEAFGAVGDGSTNDQAALQSCMNAGIPCALGPHNYRTNTAVVISTDNSFVYGYGNTSIISTTSNISAITITSKQNRLQDFEVLGNATGAAQRGIDVTGNAGLTLDYTFNQINNIYFKSLNHAGLYVTLVVGTTGSTHQGAIQAQACKAESCGIGFFFDTRAEYNLLNNCISYACTVAGYKVIGGNNMWVGGKITDTNSGASPGVILATESANDAHGVMIGAEVNHNSTGVTATSIVNGFSFIGCHFYNNGSLSITSSANIKFWNCTFSSTIFTIVSSPTTGFYNCRFPDTPTITLTGTTPQWLNNTFDAGVIPKQVINQVSGPFVYTGGSPTALTLSTEYPSVYNNFGQTQQFATGAMTLQRAFPDISPTYGFVGASTITDAAGRYVTAPIAGTNATITNNHTIWAKTTAVGSGTTNSYGATIEANTGGTNNYAAQFLGGNVNVGTAGTTLAIKEGTNGFMGQSTLVSGTKAITVTGVTTSTRCFLTRVTPSGTTLTINYDCACTANTVTIQADVAAGTINTADGSTFNYLLFQPAP